jgi:hypothetical protein
MFGWNGDEKRPGGTGLGDIDCLGRSELYASKLCQVTTTEIDSFVGVRQTVIALAQSYICVLNAFERNGMIGRAFKQNCHMYLIV